MKIESIRLFEAAHRRVLFCAHVPLMIISAFLCTASFCVCGMLRWSRPVCIMLVCFFLLGFLATSFSFWSVIWQRLRAAKREPALWKQALSFLQWGIPALVGGVVDLFSIMLTVFVFSKICGFGDEFFADRLTIPPEAKAAMPIADDYWAVNERNDALPVECDSSMEIMRAPMGYRAMVNPEEPGEVYIKAYEFSKNKRLSADRMKRATMISAKWASNQKEKFLHEGEFRIQEGDVNHPYAVRFELWFVPTSGGPERKLVECVYVIVGSYHDKPFDSIW